MGEYADMSIDDSLDQFMRRCDDPDWDAYFEDDCRSSHRREVHDIGGVPLEVMKHRRPPIGFLERIRRAKIVTRTIPCSCGYYMTFHSGKYGGWFSCVNEKCDLRFNCDNQTGEPEGNATDYETRVLRRKAHAIFDVLWKSKYISRSEAYRRLAKHYGISTRKAHFKRMNSHELRRVIVWLKKNGLKMLTRP